jgi:hypothetical protein
MLVHLCIVVKIHLQLKLNTMANPTTSSKKSQPAAAADEKQSVIDSHKTAAKHYEAAAKNHEAAARHHESGNEDKAHESALKAQGNKAMANKANKKVVKYHALKK